MPLSRYSIRNEYSLADPELYRAADKDDPEALLEGIAMAGLVGVLRQLGDLAEFAAEIFHDLHEDLMATAARGHGLTVRVQQIEAEFPSIEKAFLSQTSHSSFFYNTGVDWHPNVHMDQNLVTRGDLPRFLMDSYEECRGPPRLFLLDKFDVAGAGSCLKRYTDPSFFKAESPLSVMSNTEVQREKKGRKSKKKGSRWRNSETPEVQSTSHVKLQQLLLEERVENHINDPARRVKLKRQMNGSPFDSSMGKNYMDAILKIPTPDLDIVREISITSSPLKMPTSVAGETKNEVPDIAAINPDKKPEQRKRNTYSSSDSEAGHKTSIHALTEEYSEFSPNVASTLMDDVLSTPHEVDKNEIVVEGVRKIDGYQSDDEVDNYVDALTSMDSELETDGEYKAKNDVRFLNVNGRLMSSDATEELSDIQTHSTDCPSTGNSSLMDGGNSSSRKGKSSLSYTGSFDLAEDAPSEGDASAKTTVSAEYREAEIVTSSSDRYSFNGNSPSTQAPRHIIQDNANISSNKSEDVEPDLDAISSKHSDSKAGHVIRKEKSIHLSGNIPWKSNYDNRPSQTEDAGFSKPSLNSMDEVNDQDKHESHSSLHLPNISQLAFYNDTNENLRNNIIEGVFMEKEHALTSVASPVQSPSTCSSQKEEFAKTEFETFRTSVEPGEKASDINLAQKNDDDTNFASEVQSFLDSQHAVDDTLDDRLKDTIHLQAKDVAPAVAEANLDDTECDAASLDTRSMKLRGKCPLVLQDLHQNDLKFDEERIHESSLEETVDEKADVSSKSRCISSKTQPCDDYSDLEFLHRVSDSFSGECSGNNSHMYEENAVVCSYQNPEGAEGKSLQEINVIEKEEDAKSSPTRHLAVISTAHDLQAELYNGQYDEVSCLDQVSDSKSAHHAVVEDTEDVLSSPENHLAEVSTLDQQVESHNSNLDVKSCHVTLDQVPEYFHQTDAMDEEEDISSPVHHLTELIFPLEENYELHKDQFPLESRHDQVSQLTSSQHFNFNGNAYDSISLPTHNKAELRASLEQKAESLRDNFAVEPCQRHSDSCEKAEGSVSPFIYDTTEVKPPKEHEVEFQNNQLEVKSWHDQRLEVEHPHQTETTDSSETAVSSDTHFIVELSTPIDKTCQLEDHFDENSTHTNSGNTNTLSLIRQPESSIPSNQERESYPSSEFFALHLPSQPPFAEILPQFSVSKPAEDSLRPKFPTFDLLPESLLEETPPLPSLPPMQWRLGKVPDTFPTPEENLSGHNLSVPPLISTTKDKSPSGNPSIEAGDSYPSNSISRHSSLEFHSSPDINASQADNVVHPSDPMSCPDPDLVTNASKMLVTPPGSMLPMDHSVKSEDLLLDSKGEIFRHDDNPFSPPTTVEDTSSALPSCSLFGKTVEPLDQPTSLTSLKLEDNIQGDTIVSEEKVVNLPTTVSSLPVIHVYEKQPVLSTSEGLATWTSSSSLSLAPSEDGIPNKNEMVKPLRPRNPLIDAVVALDKSKLRKVTQLPQAQIGQKVEERDSLLEQIRARSFNLKPAVVTRPSIQGPKTNLRLAAILEKANAIRQAFAGNGSDDEDGWSDS